MKINGTIFSKPQQDQLKRGIGAELDKVVAKIDGMLNYIGDWANGNEYHENDIVTWARDGHLYEVIKAHTSNATRVPSNTEYYKAMTETKYIKHTYSNIGAQQITEIINIFKKAKNGKNVYAIEGFTVYTPSLVGSYAEAYSIGMEISLQSPVGARISCLHIEGDKIDKLTYITKNSDITKSTITTIDIIEEV